jgi:acetyltransferase-like isoleucine patch superfamily enzyme
MKPPSSTWRRQLVFILVLGLALRLGVILLAPLPSHEGVTHYDDNRYDALAWSVAQGNGYRNTFGQPEIKDPPLLPLVSACLYRVFGHHRIAVYLLQVMLSVITVALLFLLAEELVGRDAAFLAAGLTTIHPDLIVYTNLLLTETLFIFLLCAAMLVWVRTIRRPTVPRWAMTGDLLGLAALTRPLAQLLVVLVVAVTIVLWRSAPRPRYQVKMLAACLLAFLVTIAPWTLRNHLVFDRLVPITTGSGIALWVGTNVAWHGSDMRGEASIYADPDYVRVSAGDAFTAERRMLRESLEHVLDDPVGILKILPGKLMQMVKPASWIGFYYPTGIPGSALLLFPLLLFHGLILILALLGSVCGLRSPGRPRTAVVFLWTPIAYIGLLTLATIPARRYVLPAIPFVVVLAGLALSRMTGFHGTLAQSTAVLPRQRCGGARPVRSDVVNLMPALGWTRRLAGYVRARSWSLLYRGVEVGARVQVGRGCRLVLEPGAQLVLADHCTIDDGSTLAVYRDGQIVVGAGSFIGHHATLAARESVELGTGAFLAELVSIRDHDHTVGIAPASGVFAVTPVTIGKDVWLGAKVTVLRGARIGSRTVVGANGVVHGALPSDAVAVGAPARVVRRHQPEEHAAVRQGRAEPASTSSDTS